MSQVSQYEFHLFGPRKGTNATINGHPFVGGVYKIAGAPQNMTAFRNVMKFYGAFAVGTPEYEDAVAREPQETKTNGTSEVHEVAESGTPAEVQGDVQQTGAGSTQVPADAGKVNVSSETGAARSGSPGDGHEHTGIPKYEEERNRPEPVEPKTVGDENVRAAVLLLDPDNKDHWVATGSHAGFPRLSAVEEAYGKAGLTRADVEAAAPNWDRTRAVEAALES